MGTTLIDHINLKKALKKKKRNKKTNQKKKKKKGIKYKNSFDS